MDLGNHKTIKDYSLESLNKRIDNMISRGTYELVDKPVKRNDPNYGAVYYAKLKFKARHTV